jgi:hypothetical protein
LKSDKLGCEIPIFQKVINIRQCCYICVSSVLFKQSHSQTWLAVSSAGFGLRINYSITCLEVIAVQKISGGVIIQHPFTRGGPHTLWDPPLVKGCCMIVVHLVYNYHYSNFSPSLTNLFILFIF